MSFFPSLWNFGAERNPPRLHQELERMVDRFLSEEFEDPSHRPGPSFLNPMTRVREGTFNYVLSFEVPGVDPERLRVELRAPQLIVSAERGSESHRTYSRSLTLPSGVDADRIEAHFEDGTLHVSIPKFPAEHPSQAARILLIGRSHAEEVAGH